MNETLDANQKRWEQLTLEREKSAFYDLQGFETSKDRLRSIELSELGCCMTPLFFVAS